MTLAGLRERPLEERGGRLREAARYNRFMASRFISYAGFVVFSFWQLACGQSSASKSISADELEKLLERKDAIFFLDVREPFEIERLGSVKGYVNIPIGQLEARLKEIPKDKLVVTL